MSTLTAPAERRRPPTPSLRPALVVVAIAAVIVIGGAVIALVGTPTARQGASGNGGREIPGTRLRAEAAAPFLARIESAGEPPADIVGSLAVPAGSVFVARTDDDAGLSQFDRQVRLDIAAPAAEVKSFFVAMLSHEKWTTNSITEPSAGSSEVIAEKSGSDGYQWRVGVTVQPTHIVVAPALGGSGSPAAKSDVTLRLYQVEDAS